MQSNVLYNLVNGEPDAVRRRGSSSWRPWWSLSPAHSPRASTPASAGLAAASRYRITFVKFGAARRRGRRAGSCLQHEPLVPSSDSRACPSRSRSTSRLARVRTPSCSTKTRARALHLRHRRQQRGRAPRGHPRQPLPDPTPSCLGGFDGRRRRAVLRLAPRRVSSDAIDRRHLRPLRRGGGRHRRDQPLWWSRQDDPPGHRRHDHRHHLQRNGADQRVGADGVTSSSAWSFSRRSPWTRSLARGASEAAHVSPATRGSAQVRPGRRGGSCRCRCAGWPTT